jgi:hypothetical protein
VERYIFIINVTSVVDLLIILASNLFDAKKIEFSETIPFLKVCSVVVKYMVPSTLGNTKYVYQLGLRR